MVRWVAYRSAQRLVDVRVAHVLWFEATNVNRSLRPGAAYTFRFLSAEEVRAFSADAQGSLPPAMADRIVAGNDFCFAALAGPRLAAFGWFALGSIEAEHNGGMALSYPPDVTYMYNGFTFPEFRGQRLHGLVKALGLRALAAMALACGLLVGGLIPALARGAPPLAASGVFCGVALLGVFAIAGRVDMKAVSALIGSVVGLGVAGGLLLALTRVLGFSGTESVPARFLAWVSGRAGVRYDYLGLATASLLAATLGLVMDIAVTVAAGVAQVGAARPGIGRRESLAAGMNISRDVVGTMVLTLVFAFVGMRLPVLLLPPGLGLSPAEVVNGEAGSLEVLYVLVGSLALATTGPATALAAALLASRVPRRESRRPPRRAPALVLAIAASVWVVAGGLVWWRLRGERLSHAARVALPRDVDGLLQVARRARRQGRSGEALVALWECIERRPRDPRAEVELAYVSMARRWLAHARYHIERALALGADDSFAHYVAGVVYIWTGQKADARRHLMRALELDPDNAPARQALATVLLD